MAINKLEKQLKKQKEISKARRENNLKVLRNKKHSIEKAFFCDTMEDSKTKVFEILLEHNET